MIQNNRNKELNLRFIVKVDDSDYVIFATSAGMKCFFCGEEGYMVKACPRQGDLKGNMFLKLLASPTVKKQRNTLLIRSAVF